jgi:hypothetical protein
MSDYRTDYDDEGSGRTADLDAAAAQQRDQESRHDRGEEPSFGSHARGNGEGHGKGKRYDSYGEACRHIPHGKFSSAIQQRRPKVHFHGESRFRLNDSFGILPINSVPPPFPKKPKSHDSWVSIVCEIIPKARSGRQTL